MNGDVMSGKAVFFSQKASAMLGLGLQKCEIFIQRYIWKPWYDFNHIELISKW